MKYKILSNRTEEFKKFNDFNLTEEEVRVNKANERAGVITAITDPVKHNTSWYDRELNKFNAYVNYYLENGFEPYGDLKYFETEEKEGLLTKHYKVFMQTLIQKGNQKVKRKLFHEQGNHPINPPRNSQ